MLRRRAPSLGPSQGRKGGAPNESQIANKEMRGIDGPLVRRAPRRGPRLRGAEARRRDQRRPQRERPPARGSPPRRDRVEPLPSSRPPRRGPPCHAGPRAVYPGPVEGKGVAAVAVPPGFPEAL